MRYKFGVLYGYGRYKSALSRLSALAGKPPTEIAVSDFAMRFFSGLTSLAVLAATGAFAFPAASPDPTEIADVVERSAAAVTSLSASAMNAIVPFANFAAAAYCNVSKWKCSKSQPHHLHSDQC